MDDYMKKMDDNRERNNKFIEEFREWLVSKKLGSKTIKKHIDNVELYLNEYLNYYDVETMENGIYGVCSFLDGWFIEKCMWASKTSIKETASSLKKFYFCMSEKGYVNRADYDSLCDDIKDSMDDILEALERFDNLADDEDMWW